MSLYRRGKVFHYDFYLKGVRHQGSTHTGDLAEAKEIEENVKKSARAGVFSPRKREARNKRGGWKVGGPVSYFQYHMRVRKARGRPSRCEKCGTTDQTKTFDWANLTGNYHDIWDYARMCRECHRRYDRERRLSESAGASSGLLGVAS